MSKLLQEVRDLIRTLHYSVRTEQTYANWIKQYILYHRKRHPAEMFRETAILSSPAKQAQA